MSWIVEHWPWIAGAVLALFVLGVAWQRMRKGNPTRVKQQRLEADARVPLRRWTQAASMLVSRDCDYGHLARGDARRMLQRWWHVHGIRELRDVLDVLAHSNNPDNAWDLLRFILVARLGEAAGMLEVDESWRLCAPIALRLQRAYDDWDDMAMAYVRARRQWRELALDGSQDDGSTMWIVENMSTLRATTWNEIPFALDLEIE